jgi:hypothetical protein
MNANLHHQWNAARDTTRGACQERVAIPEEETKQNKVLLKQNKPK